MREAPAGADGLPDEAVPQDSPGRFLVRLNATAARVVGRWMLTLPAGFAIEAEATLTDDGCVKLGGNKGNNLFGKFAVRGDRQGDHRSGLAGEVEQPADADRGPEQRRCEVSRGEAGTPRGSVTDRVEARGFCGAFTRIRGLTPNGTHFVIRRLSGKALAAGSLLGNSTPSHRRLAPCRSK